MAIPYLNINDLQLVADMDFGPEEISIPTLEIYALRGLLTCIVHGSMKKAKGGWDQDLDMQLRDLCGLHRSFEFALGCS